MARKPKLRNAKGAGGSPFLRKDGRWTASVTIGYRDGKQIKKWVYGSSQREVVEQLRALHGQASSAILPNRENLNLGIWLDRFSDARGRDLKPSTWDMYKHYVRHWKRELGDTPLARVNPLMIRAALVRFSDANLGDSYRKALYNFINAALHEAVKLDILEVNPVVKVDRPKVKVTNTRGAWTEEEARAFLEVAAGHPLEPLFSLCLVCGLRIGEALALHWNALQGDSLNIDYSLNRSKDGGMFTTPKWGSFGSLPLHTETLAMLEQHRLKFEKRKTLAVEAGLWKEHALMFPSEVGTPLNYRNVLRVFDGFVLKAGIPRYGGSHAFRRTFVTLAMGQLEPKEVQEIVRHKSSVITMDVYARVRNSRRKKLGLSLTSLVTLNDTSEVGENQ
jgi:integrase